MIFTGKMIKNPDGTTTWVNPDGSILAHGKAVRIKPKKGESVFDAVYRQFNPSRSNDE